MMEQREKLIELLKQDPELFFDKMGSDDYEILTDYLIANGVVVLPCRCKDCEYWEYEPDTKGEIYKKHLCDAFECCTTAYDFCSYGERR